MGIFQIFRELFENLFLSSTPEVQKKQQLKKLESELRAVQPSIYKNGNFQPNFAEAIRLLYVHSKKLDDLFSETISNEDVKLSERFMDRLVISGFTNEEQNLLSRLTYEPRKQEIDNNRDNVARIFDMQRKNLNTIISRLNNQDFLKMDVVLADLSQLADFCRFNFVSILTAFDAEFSGYVEDYKPSFSPVEPKNIEKSLADLYFLSSNLKITKSVANAIVALVQLRYGNVKLQRETADAMIHLKSILYILNHIVSESVLKAAIGVARENPNPTLEKASYKSSARQKFSGRIQDHFDADERRIRQELKDENTNAELNKLFGMRALDTLEGYSNQLNDFLQNNSALAFQWVRPLEIIKTFINVYLPTPIINLLTDIVIEGFFTNSEYKTEFASNVYACSECAAQIASFESAFKQNGRYFSDTIKGYIRDSHKNSEFTKQLVTIVAQINKEAKDLVVNLSNSLYALNLNINDMLIDSKKAKNEIIENLKVLFISSRNRDNADALERQFPQWELFFDVMKNYTTLSKKPQQNK